MVTRELEPEWVRRAKKHDAKIKADVDERARKEKEFVGDYHCVGWLNGWKYAPDIYARCTDRQHDTKILSLSDRGSHNVIKCDECKYYYLIDWSD